MYLPKSMRKRLPPDFLLNFNIDTIINKLQNQLLNKVFGVVEDALGLNDNTKKSGVPGITLSNKDY